MPGSLEVPSVATENDKNHIFNSGKKKTDEKRGAFDSAKNHKRQRRKRQYVTAKREKSRTPKFV